MNVISRTLLMGATFLATAGLGANITIAEQAAKTATVELKNLEGSKVGAAKITQTPHGVLVYVKVSDLPPGAKGIHLHSKASCTSESSFKSSLGHHAEMKGQHGLLNAQGPGKGDLGNIYIAENGVGEMQFFKAGVFLDQGDQPLLDEDGTAIVIHANEDDQVTQPIGGAGPRLVCGLVKVS